MLCIQKVQKNLQKHFYKLRSEFNKVGEYEVNKHMEEEYISVCQQHLTSKNFEYNIYNSIKKY